MKQRLRLIGTLLKAPLLNELLALSGYPTCRIIITSRDYHKEKYKNKKGLNLYYLKGFNDELVEKYFEKRFQDKGNLVKRALNYVKTLNIKTQDHYLPLFLSLITDIVERETKGYRINDDISKFNTEYFRMDEVLDNLIVRLIDREIDKPIALR